MFATSYVLVCTGVLTIGVNAFTGEETAAIRASLFPLITECSKEHNVNDQDIGIAKETLSTSGLKPCFLGCFLEKAKILDNNGQFDWETTKQVSKKYIKNEEDFKQFETIGKACLAVNDKTVSDGNKGCDRAKLLLDCFIENKGDLSPFTSA